MSPFGRKLLSPKAINIKCKRRHISDYAEGLRKEEIKQFEWEI